MNILDQYMEEEVRQLRPVEMGNPLAYPTLALTAEAGELANVVKEVLFSQGGVVTESDSLKLLDESGDVFWYVSQILYLLGYTWEDAIAFNRAKLAERRRQGKRKMETEK